MTDKTTNTDSESDVEEGAEQSLTTRAKAYLLAAYAYVAGAIAQSVEEIAPQLRSISLPGVSSRAAKSLLLAGVLITAAVAMPADPFDGGETTVETQDPVQGETYEATDRAPTFDGATMNQLPSTFTDADADAPAPPDQVRASAGSQTMNVKTSVVDGEPAIVLKDDRTHDGRWVSLETAWFEESLGEVPNAAFITHESGDEYAAPLQVRGDSAAFYVREFSTNTVTFDGGIQLSGAQAGDGSEFQYELANTSGVDDPSINLTGVTNTAPGSTSGTYSNGDGFSVDIGGTNSPQNETITLIGKSKTTDRTVSGTQRGSGTATESISIGGTEEPTGTASGEPALTITGSRESSYSGEEYLQEGGQPHAIVIPAPGDSVNEVEFKHDIFASDEWYSVDFYVEPGNNSGSGSAGGTQVGSDIDISAQGTQTFTFDSIDTSNSNYVTFWVAGTTNGGDASMNSYVTAYTPSPSGVSASTDGGSTAYFGSLSDGETTTRGIDLDKSTSQVDISTDSGEIDYELSWTEKSFTRDPSVSIGGKTVSHSGTLSDGETVTKSVSLPRGSQPADVSTSAHNVGVEVSFTEVSQTVDPVVEVNGETTGMAGTLSDAETASLDTSSAWLQEGTNTVTISTDSPASGPASLVGFEYSHGAETTTSATVDETTWSQSTNVSKTWAGDRANATATIPLNDRVVSVRDVEMRTNGSSWQTVSSSDYTLNGTDLTVQLGDVASGSTTEVRATGSKVRVTDGAITVLDPSTSSATLNTRIQIDDAGPDFALSVDETTFANRVHYAENATWGAANGATTISASGEQTFTLPDATAGAEATVRTWPVEVEPTTGTVTVPELEGDRTEPGIAVRGDGNSEVDYTFVDATDATPYILYSTTNGIVRDEGLASSPITLTDDNSDETLVFQVDDGSASGSSSGSDATVGGGGPAPMEAASGGFTALQALIPDGSTLLLGATLLGGLFVVGRRSGVITEDRQQAATSAASSAVGAVNSLVERALANQIVVGALILGAGAFVLGTGVLPGDARLIVGLGTAPVAVYLALQQFGEFDIRVWGGSTIVIALLGLNVLAPEFFQTIAQEAGILIVIAGAYLGYKAIQAFRAEAETPDEQTNVTFEVNDDDGGN